MYLERIEKGGALQAPWRCVVFSPQASPTVIEGGNRWFPGMELRIIDVVFSAGKDLKDLPSIAPN